MTAYADTYAKLVAFLEGRCSVRTLDDAEDHDCRTSFESIFGRMFGTPDRLAHGARAETLYARERPGAFVVLSQPRASFTPHASNSPFAFALLCELASDEGPFPLGGFCQLEPCILAADFTWAMVHRHEDHETGGPYFARAESGEWAGSFGPRARFSPDRT